MVQVSEAGELKLREAARDPDGSETFTELDVLAQETSDVNLRWAANTLTTNGVMRGRQLTPFATRVDVLFQNVKAMKLPTSLDGLIVTEGRPREQRANLIGDGNAAGRMSSDLCRAQWRVRRLHRRWGLHEDEDEGEYFDPSQLWPEP